MSPGWCQPCAWSVVERFAELTGGRPAISSAAVHAVVDGLFHQALLSRLDDDPDAAADPRAGITAVIAQVLPTA